MKNTRKKQFTPMERMKYLFESFNDLVKIKINNNFRMYYYNKNEKTDFYALNNDVLNSEEYKKYKTVVEADYCRVFEFDDKTFLFINFYNIKEEISKVYLEVLFIENYNSAKMKTMKKTFKFLDFKLKFKKIIEELLIITKYNNNFKSKDFSKLFNSNFELLKKNNLEEEIVEIETENISYVMNEVVKEYNVSLRKYNKIKTTYLEITNKLINKEKYLNKKHNVMELKKSYEDAKSIVTNELKKFKKENNYIELNERFKLNQSIMTNAKNQIKRVLNNKIHYLKINVKLQKKVEDNLKKIFKKYL